MSEPTATKTGVFLAVVTLVALGPGCRKTSDPSPGPDFSGRWTGPAQQTKGGSDYRSGLTITLHQTGSSLIGTFVDSASITHADSGLVSGGIVGDTARLSITLTNPPPSTRCGGVLRVTVTKARGALEGGYAGRDCDSAPDAAGDTRRASFRLIRTVER